MGELEGMVKAGEDQDGMQKRMNHLKNLSKTMSDLVKSIVAEVEDSREQMYNIIEGLRESTQQTTIVRDGKAKSWHGRKMSNHLGNEASSHSN
mmetsp:Transcript_5587/g.4262  ORF Transcript_5587/g.4262 Transcript_5587/m.4262 type:complete len:93 (+) Transcript_5587:262-540(+)